MKVPSTKIPIFYS